MEKNKKYQINQTTANSEITTSGRTVEAKAQAFGYKDKKISKKVLITFFILLVIGLIELALIAIKIDSKHSNQNTETLSPRSFSNSSKVIGFDKNKYSTYSSNSIWAVVNKGRILPSGYVPAGLTTPKVSLYYSAAADDSHLRADAAKAIEAMFAAAKTQGYNLKLVSGYRSYNEQITVYNGFVKSDGQAEADTFSARPGHSEHQTGLAADVSTLRSACELRICFGDTAEGKWISNNSYKFGFIVRYQKSKETVTGYEYEPWHIRYVGLDLAEQIHKTGQTLEQFFNLPIYTSYPAQSYKLS